MAGNIIRGRVLLMRCGPNVDCVLVTQRLESSGKCRGERATYISHDTNPSCANSQTRYVNASRHKRIVSAKN